MHVDLACIVEQQFHLRNTGVLSTAMYAANATGSREGIRVLYRTPALTDYVEPSFIGAWKAIGGLAVGETLYLRAEGPASSERLIQYAAGVWRCVQHFGVRTDKAAIASFLALQLEPPSPTALG